MEADPIRVVVLAPNLAIRVGLHTLIAASAEFQVVAEVAEVSELMGVRADVILLQGEVPLEGLATLSGTGQALSVLWVHDDSQATHTLRSLPLRAWGLLSSEASAEELVAALQAIYQGLIVAPPVMLEPLWVENPQTVSDELIDQLTPREMEILQLLAQGLANKQIALELEISEHTVKFHVSSIFSKLGVTNRMEAVRLGLQLGLITL